MKMRGCFFVTRNEVKRGWRYCDSSKAAIFVFFVAIILDG
jgi:hypothetical protein